MKLIFALTGSIKGESSAKRSRDEGREKRCRFFGARALKLTEEFRFLYNRFNLIPRAPRPFQRGCERKKNIYFRGIRLSRVTTCPSFFFLPFLHVLFFILQFDSSLLPFMRVAEKKVFFAESTMRDGHNYLDS